MFTIHLHNLKFYSYHGVHEEENILGNEYEVNADVGYTAREKVTRLTDTINYVSIFLLIKKHMDNPTPLLESLVQRIAHDIKAMDARVNAVSVNIKKTNPPVLSYAGNVAVTYSI